MASGALQCHSLLAGLRAAAPQAVPSPTAPDTVCRRAVAVRVVAVQAVAVQAVAVQAVAVQAVAVRLTATTPWWLAARRLLRVPPMGQHRRWWLPHVTRRLLPRLGPAQRTPPPHVAALPSAALPTAALPAAEAVGSLAHRAARRVSNRPLMPIAPCHRRPRAAPAASLARGLGAPAAAADLGQCPRCRLAAAARCGAGSMVSGVSGRRHRARRSGVCATSRLLSASSTRPSLRNCSRPAPSSLWASATTRTVALAAG